MDNRRSRCRCLFSWLILLMFCLHASSQDDTDKCRPQFGYEKFMIIDEDVEINSPVLTINTTGSSSEVNLTMKANAHFAFNASSQNITVKSPLDADAGPNIVTLTIVCRETNKQPVEITVMVTIQDINDNPPKFAEDHFYVNVSETMTVDQLFDSQVIATDDDTSFINSAIYYSVEDGTYSDYFQFPDALSPNLVLRKALDFERLPSMTITVVATNQLSTDKQLNSTALLTIRVKDEDDLNPVFSSPLYEGSILETAEMNTVVNVTPPIFAADEDVTLNEPVYYSFHDQFFLCDRDAQSSQNVFSIDNETAEVRLIGPVSPAKVSVVVQATQRNNPSRYGVAMLVITVVGVNSNAPKFERPVYQTFVSEAMPAGNVVLVVSATDQDFGASIRYSMVDDNADFDIDAQSGKISLKTPLDYETTKAHSFDIMASDGNMESTATVEVTVVDANDNAPVVVNQTLSFDAERDFTGVITHIQAHDEDAGTVLSFRLANHNSLFSINDTGNLRISADPADLTDSQYLLVIIVSDSGGTTAAPHERTVLATINFPALTTLLPPVTASPTITSSEPTTTTTTTKTTVMAAASNDIIAIALGVLAAVLLVIVIVLIIFICHRRNQTTEQLDKAKINRSPDPRGLKFQNAGRAPGSRVDPLHYLGDDVLDGPTTIQENPLSFKEGGGAFNPAFVYPDDRGESDQHLDEIQIETAVIPYQAADAFNNNHHQHHGRLHHDPSTEMYQHDDSSEYGDTLPPPPHKHGLMYPENTSSESLTTSHNSSGDLAAKQLLIGNGVTSFGTTSFGKTVASDMGGGGGGKGLNPDTSVAPQEQKSELTVYF